jgi:hypothetical protein
MFGQKAQTAPESSLKEIQSQHRLELLELRKNHELALKEKEFELKHFKDDEVAKLKAEVSKVNQENAVLKKENEMLEKITNLNADIIDIKSLVANLIEKLPTINLSSLTLNGSNKE